MPAQGSDTATSPYPHLPVTTHPPMPSPQGSTFQAHSSEHLIPSPHKAPVPHGAAAGLRVALIKRCHMESVAVPPLPRCRHRERTLFCSVSSWRLCQGLG